MSALELLFLTRWAQLAPPTLPEPAAEYRFATKRRFRFDFAWPPERVAVEIEGGTWTGGRHTRGAGYSSDCTKYNLAVMNGWRVLRFTGDMLHDDPQACIASVVELIQQAQAEAQEVL